MTEVPMATVDATTAILDQDDVRAILADEARGDERFRVLLDRVAELDAERDAPALFLAVKAMVEPVKLGQHTYEANEFRLPKGGSGFEVYSQHPASRSRFGKAAVVSHRFTSVLSFFEGRLADLKAKADKKAAKAKAREAIGNPFKVGDLLYHSFGYDETHYHFAQVVKVNPKSVVIRRVARKHLETVGYGQDYIAPAKGEFLKDGEPKTCILQVSGSEVYLSGWSKCGDRERFMETSGYH